jgi:hypothetical protein
MAKTLFNVATVAVAISALAVPSLAAITSFETLEVAAGDTKAMLRKDDPFSLRITSKGQTLDGDGAAYIKQTYKKIELIGTGAGLPKDLSPDQADVVHRADETDNYYFAGLGTHVGGDAGVDVISVNYLAKKSFEYSTLNAKDVKADYPDMQVCLTPVTAEATCAKKSVEAGDFKFSIYVVATGQNYALPAGATHLRVTTEYAFVGSTSGVSAYFNGDKTKTKPGTGQLTSITLVNTNENTESTWDFVQTCNVNNKETADMQITASVVTTADVPTITVNYDIPATGVTAKDNYVVYDPTISVGPASNPSSASSAGLSAVAALCVAGAAALAARF